MLPITNDVMAEISALQWLTPDQLKAEYGEYLSDAQNCQRIEILRSLVIYRLQEKFYGIKLPRAIGNTLDETVAGDRLLHAPADDLGKCVGKKLFRNWKGKDYEVLLLGDNSVEYDGKKYKSLTAVAKVITGTHWNGPVFFGVKK